MGDKRQEIANELILIISGKGKKSKEIGQTSEKRKRTVKPYLAFLKR